MMDPWKIMLIMILATGMLDSVRPVKNMECMVDPSMVDQKQLKDGSMK